MVKLVLKSNSKLVLNHMKIKYYPPPPFYYNENILLLVQLYTCDLFTLEQRLQWVRSGISTTMEVAAYLTAREVWPFINSQQLSALACIYGV